MSLVQAGMFTCGAVVLMSGAFYVYFSDQFHTDFHLAAEAERRAATCKLWFAASGLIFFGFACAKLSV